MIKARLNRFDAAVLGVSGVFLIVSALGTALLARVGSWAFLAGSFLNDRTDRTDQTWVFG